ncbi:MAG: hypothetical protein EAZ88_09375 [Oscillatoriales cyanobacterium]|jgi:hypothetical protein|nr:MAG: hypothetical protein EAZ88_09375 [Oscillatoriales cyanobacterium]
MFDWLFKPTVNGYSREVEVRSSRHGKKTVVLWADEPIGGIDALRTVANQLPALEPGESREIKTYLGG